MSLLVYNAQVLYLRQKNLAARDRTLRFVKRQIAANGGTILDEGPEMPDSDTYPLTIALDEYRPGSLQNDCLGHIYVGPADGRSANILYFHPNSPVRGGRGNP